jgi:hypothetical protein
MRLFEGLEAGSRVYTLSDHVIEVQARCVRVLSATEGTIGVEVRRSGRTASHGRRARLALPIDGRVSRRDQSGDAIRIGPVGGGARAAVAKAVREVAVADKVEGMGAGQKHVGVLGELRRGRADAGSEP